MKTSLFSIAFVAALPLCVNSHAAIDAEMEGMEAVSRDDGTFLVGGPTYQFDRILGAGGLHSESELWTPQKLRQRVLFNRMSITPSWAPLEASVWAKTAPRFLRVVSGRLRSRASGRLPAVSRMTITRRILQVTARKSWKMNSRSLVPIIRCSVPFMVGSGTRTIL